MNRQHSQDPLSRGRAARRHRWAAAVLALVATGAAAAPDDSGGPADPEATAAAEAKPAGEPETPFGDEITVTAGRREQRLAEVPLRIETIGRSELERMQARTLAEALEWTSGLRVESGCQNCNFTEVRMLGLEGPYTQFLVDGQEALSSLARVYGIDQIPARWIGGLEVVKGGGSAIYGAGAVAGVVNLLPHEVTRTRVELDLRASRFEEATSGSVAGVFDWRPRDDGPAYALLAQADRVPGVDLTGDSFTEVSARDLFALEGRHDRIALAGRASLRLSGSWLREDRRGGNRLGAPPHDADIAEWIDSEILAASARWLQQLSPATTLSASLSQSRTDRESYYGAGRDPLAYGATEADVGIADLQLDRYGGRGTWSLGVQGSRRSLHDRPRRSGELVDAHDAVGLFAQHDVRAGERWTLLYGARVDRHSEIDGAVVSPRLSALYRPHPELTLRGSLARGFRAPEVFDEDLHLTLVGGGETRVTRNSPSLAEERSTNALVSLEWLPDLGKGSAVVDFTAFRTDLDGQFLARPADDPATPVVEYERVNHGESRVEGMELTLGHRVPGRFTVEASWVLQRARYGEPEPEFGRRDFLRTPRRLGNARLSWSLPYGDLVVGARYVGAMRVPHYAGFVPETRLETTAPFVVVDAGWTFPVALRGGTEASVTIGGRNLGDERQPDPDQGPNRDASYVYGPRHPRSFAVSLRLAR
jgi:outer membrane receptor for ferrienterochelin and colicins